MPSSHPRPNLTAGEFKILRDLIQSRTGIYFDDAKREILADKLSARLIERGFGAFIDYYYLLQYDPRSEEEWNHVLSALSVPETYFWREMDQVRALVDVLVPQHFSSPGAAPLRIWSAACATGEEPLTIAMALDESGWFKRAAIEVVASDGNLNSLAKARQGLYLERAFRQLPGALRDRYFTATGEGWQVDPALHRRIDWQFANLMDPGQLTRLLPANIIFCRNVFIYFSPEAITQTLNRFFVGMPEAAYLFVGVSESLLRFTHDFELQEIGRAFVYQKRLTR